MQKLSRTLLGETLKKLFSPTLEKALTFLDDKLLPSTSNAVERGNRRYRKMQKKQNPQSARRNNFPGEQISRWFQLLSENLFASNYPGAAKSVYRVRTQEQIRARLALDMWREAQAEGRQQTLASLHQARAG